MGGIHVFFSCRHLKMLQVLVSGIRPVPLCDGSRMIGGRFGQEGRQPKLPLSQSAWPQNGWFWVALSWR